MSSVRTQNNRYWIQMEVMPEEGHGNGMRHFDLNMVDTVSFLRNEAGEITLAQMVYAGVMKPVSFPGKAAQYFYEKWSEFVYINSKMPEVEKGLIHIAHGIDKPIRLNA